MSNITLVNAEKEGLSLKSNICALGFPASVATILASNYKEIVEGPVVATVTAPTTDGRPHPLAAMLGIVESQDIVAEVYSMGELEFAEGDKQEGLLWVSNVDGVIRWSYTDRVGLEEAQATNDTLEGSLASFAFHEEDLDEVLELLSTDLTDESNYVEYEG